jgi:RimJ/RimL family protein N-acetyltransferase
MDDLSFVMATERLPGYEHLTARWTWEEHCQAMAQENTLYLIAQSADLDDVGFVILQPIADHHEGTKLKRICVSTPGRGVGGALLSAVISWVFTTLHTDRLWLDVFVDNEHARRAYRRVGFSEDGILRSAYRNADGLLVDRVLMSLLRSERRA